MLYPGTPALTSAVLLTYHFSLLTSGAQLLVSDQHGASVEPPGLRGERNGGGEDTVRVPGAAKKGQGWTRRSGTSCALRKSRGVSGLSPITGGG